MGVRVASLCWSQGFLPTCRLSSLWAPQLGPPIRHQGWVWSIRSDIYKEKKEKTNGVKSFPKCLLICGGGKQLSLLLSNTETCKFNLLIPEAKKVQACNRDGYWPVELLSCGEKHNYTHVQVYLSMAEVVLMERELNIVPCSKSALAEFRCWCLSWARGTCWIM